MEYKQVNIESLVGKHFRDEPVELYNLSIRGVSYDEKEGRAIMASHTAGQNNIIFLRGKINPGESHRTRALLNLIISNNWQVKARGIYNTRTFGGKDNSSGELEVHYIECQNVGLSFAEETEVGAEERLR